jgi:hypothetical protein
VITWLAWLPLVVLTIFIGRFAGGVKVPFLYDFEVHARLLFSLPLMILAELVVYIRMRGLVAQFVERQIITEKLLPAFNAFISSAMRLRNSLAAEIGLLLFVVLAGHFIWRKALALDSDTWYATVSSFSRSYTLAGYWYSFVSIPVFQFILIRWYYRVFHLVPLPVSRIAARLESCGAAPGPQLRACIPRQRDFGLRSARDRAHRGRRRIHRQPHRARGRDPV